VPKGPYFVIPILGPSDVRDGITRVGDTYMSPLQYVRNNYVKYGIYGVEVVDIRYRLLPQDHLLDEAYDPYTFLKNAYLQRRDYLVRDNKISDKDRQQQEQQQYDEEKKILEESGPDESEAKPKAPSQPQGSPPPKTDQPPPKP
jgi:phospholipid-binding lipoprotein MlaA